MDSEFETLSRLLDDERFELLRGRRARSGSPVLVKRVLGGSAGAAAALQREAGIAASVPGAAPLLPRLLDVRPAAVLVMDDPGGELLSRLLRAGRCPLELALAIARQVAGALAELHGRGLLHNGLRPAAILCNEPEQRAWLVDFGEAGSAAARPAALPEAARGAARLVYASPEQTGRIERGVDARSDLYSLGIVLYELLTGAPPFRSDDTLALIHWHLAGVPREPAEADPAVPRPLSDIVMKLLAKTPDERYQSAAGLAHDLALCAQAWAAEGRIEPFALGRRDIGDHLVISSKLHGREREVQRLQRAFERACAGRGGGTMLLVEGYSGIGKTSLIQQLYRPIVRQRGYFISGKFDQVVRGVPFGALIQAFHGLVRQLLSESEAQLGVWRDRLTAALGVNGGVLAEVIPEIAFIIGPSPEPAVLGSTESQNRFQRVLQQFVAALARPEHPLVLFLDDLQWADAATLGLLEPLLTSPDIGCLMLMGAYRDNELDASPRLARTLATLEAGGVVLERVALGPLGVADLVELVADSLHCNATQAAPLAELVHRKTGGNPFFVIQFLKLLEREGQLRFSEAQMRWDYDSAQIADTPLADNVVDLMTRSIQRLPHKAQYALTLAACIGNRFDLATLALVSEQSLAATADDLALAVGEGLIVGAARAFGDTAQGEAGDARGFAFLHDRVQQSAYALIPAERRQMVHLTVGRLLRSRATPEQLEAGLFDIVHHLNLGRAFIQESTERREVAALNLAAGRRAKTTTAHDTALELFRCGLDLLGANARAQDPELHFELQLEAAESLYLCGQFEPALQALAELDTHAGSAIARARIARLRSVQLENMARYHESLASARDGLAPFGVVFPETAADKAAALEREIATIGALRGEREIAALVDLPTMTDAPTRIVMSMLTDIWSAAYIIGDPLLARLISATMVRLSLEHGNVEESAYGYVTHAITVGAVRGEYRVADAFGRLALAVNRRFDDARRRAKIYQQFHAHVNFWCQPWRSCIEYAREACRSGLDSGDFLYAAYGAGTEPWSAMAATQDLAQFVRDYTPSITLIEKLKATGFADSVRVITHWALALQGRTHGPLSFSDTSFDEAAYVERYRDNPFFTTVHAVARLHLCVLLGSAPQMLEAARHSAGLVHNVPGTVWPLLHEFWHAMALAANADTLPADERRAALEQLKAAEASFHERAQHCAENFLGEALLLGAELARLEGRTAEAVEACERAIEFAASVPLLPQQALSHELLGRLRSSAGQGQLARLHLAQAAELYGQWGASAKVAALQQQSPGPVRGPTAPAPAPESDGLAAPPSPSDTAGELDLFSVLKAAQAIAADVELEGLLTRLLHITIENAGAERGALVLEGDDGPVVHTAVAATGAVPAEVHSTALPLSDAVPVGIVHYVRRTAELVVLADAALDEQHGADPYIARHRPRSLLCMPLQRQGHTVGVLYLEHRRADSVFTPQRLRTLSILATQAAISLEGARLFASLRQEIAERQQAQEQLAGALAEVERLREDLEAENSYLRRDLIANVSHDLRTPLVSMRGYLEVLASKGDTLAPEQRRQYLGVAVRQSEHLARLIDALFELAKLDFKGMTLNCEPFHFGELAADVLQKFQLEAEGKRVELAVDAERHLPFVEADVSLMERVLENLIGNALRHTPGGGRVCVQLSAEAGRLLAQISDTGSGIAKADLPFVFERFYRGGGERGGAGLGLAITRRILELHGAQIAVESEPGEGTCFTFDLPLHSAAAGMR